MSITDDAPLILVAGAPRSGTTWLGKIFDSHPDVIYRHEPDAARPCHDFPFLVHDADYARHAEAARRYLLSLTEVRQASVVGKRPVFRKNFIPSGGAAARRGMIAAALALQKVPIARPLVASLQIPDLYDRRVSRPPYVLKSVISLGRAGLFHHVEERLRIVLIVRHPCGYVSSRLRGARSGRMASSVPIQTMAQAPEAAEFSLTLERLESFNEVERLAWQWTLFNHKVLRDLEGSDRLLVVRHDDLSSSTEDQVRRIFAFAGLAWNQQTEAFLARSTSGSKRGGDTRFYDVQRDSRHEVAKWRDELERESIDTIRRIAGSSPLVAGFVED